MPTVHMIHGYLGAGKTTFARRLEAEKAAVRFTHDEWMRKLYGRDPQEAQFADCAQRVFELMEAMWTRCLAVGVDVILDSGFWSRKERDRMRSMAASLGANCLLYRLSCPDDVAWDRIEKRNNAPDAGLCIAPNTFRMLKARFEPLSEDESRIDVDLSGRIAGQEAGAPSR